MKSSSFGDQLAVGTLAPATATATGTPRLSSSVERFMPSLPRTVGFYRFFPRPAGLGQRVVHALPHPIDPLQLVVLGQAAPTNFTVDRRASVAFFETKSLRFSGSRFGPLDRNRLQRRRAVGKSNGRTSGSNCARRLLIRREKKTTSYLALFQLQFAIFTRRTARVHRVTGTSKGPSAS